MLRSRLAGLCAALVWLPGAAEAQDAGEDAVSRLLETPAARIEPGLPGEPFGDWLRGLLPAGAPPLFRTGPCPEGPGRCVSVELDIVSRARLLRLDFAVELPRFLGGSVAAPDAGPQPPIGALAELPGRLVAPIRPQPLECPEGTRTRLREMQAGLHEWCEDLDGLKHGPARSWFATGRYLMTRGRHERGKRVGSWIECDRFERCRRQGYP